MSVLQAFLQVTGWFPYNEGSNQDEYTPQEPDVAAVQREYKDVPKEALEEEGYNKEVERLRASEYPQLNSWFPYPGLLEPQLIRCY